MVRLSRTPSLRSNEPAGPLIAYLDSYERLLIELGYAEDTIRKQTQLIADFSGWLTYRGIAVEDLISAHTGRFMRCRVHHRRRKNGDAPALRRFLHFLQRIEVIARESAPTKETPTLRLLDEYSLYLQQERGLAAGTIAQYGWFTRRFLVEHFGGRSAHLSRLRTKEVVGFVQREAARLQSPKRAQLLTAALRSFFRFAHYRAYVNIDLAAAVPSVANWSMAAIPRAISPEHARRVLAHCDRRSAVGRRDYAILLLLARLGLRAQEVAYLKLQDIDWENGCLSVRGKGGRESQLPLPADVGQAIADYLQKGRPSKSDSRSIFLSARAPIGSFITSGRVSKVVRRALSRAGVESSRRGAHQFRHALATQLLRQGSSLSEIGAVLRHRDADTTKIYAKVDLSSLRTLALPWPRIVR